MTVQAGIYNRRRRPLDQTVAAEFCAELASFFDFPFEVHRYPFTLLALGRNSVNGSPADTYSTPSRCVTVDGRIDEPHIEPARVPKFVDTSFEAFPRSCWRSLIGDFAISLWDDETGTLHLVRDGFGTRPLYVIIDDEIALWCSSLSFLASLLPRDCEIDDAYVAAYLTDGDCTETTPYVGIRSVPPGVDLTIQGQDVGAEPFWSLPCHGSLSYGTDQEYEMHFLQIFRESIRRRLRDSKVAISDLSGGVDSPSIVCVADDLMRDGVVSCTDLETVSFRYDGSSLSDESKSIALVEQKRGKASHHIFEDDFLARDVFAQHVTRPDWWLLLPASTKRYCELKESIAADVLLCGLGGDELFDCGNLPTTEIRTALQGWQPIRAYQTAVQWARGEGSTVGHFFGTAVRQIAKSVCVTEEEFTAEQPELLFQNLSERFLARFNCRQNMLTRRWYPEVDDPTLRHQYAILSQLRSFSSECTLRELLGYDMSYPFLDRSLVEFLLSIPPEQKRRPGQTKSLLRRAVRTILPEKLRLRKDKIGGPSQSFLRAIRDKWPDIVAELDDAEIFRRGYADREAFLSHLRAAKHGLIKAALLSTWKLFALERFLREQRSRKLSSFKLRDLLLRSADTLSHSSLADEEHFEASNERR